MCLLYLPTFAVDVVISLLFVMQVCFHVCDLHVFFPLSAIHGLFRLGINMHNDNNNNSVSEAR